MVDEMERDVLHGLPAMRRRAWFRRWWLHCLSLFVISCHVLNYGWTMFITGWLVSILVVEVLLRWLVRPNHGKGH